MVSVEINLANISDWPSFHRVFKEAMGFPDFYGDNLNAWSDCMLDLSRPNTVGMTKVVVPEGEDLLLVLSNSIKFRSEHSDIFTVLFDTIASLNCEKNAVEGASRLLILMQ